MPVSVPFAADAGALVMLVDCCVQSCLSPCQGVDNIVAENPERAWPLPLGLGFSSSFNPART
jgi:hypothetical protein